ncbi:PaaI family thioesterase [Martelella mediterranea]|uniref:PaaI family thioesterase n=1 Tax=Martelella mediterranea TaxID=293089 RepID=UPI001E2F397D|nr:PaaI family thioesterase [Martelella mediterranea]MCD1636466.1 PaaI family thioesterase [Martelella mediterranea]
MAGFYSARDRIIPPLPWPTFAPPFSRREDSGFTYALETGEAHANAIGLVHGGVIAGLADQAIALVAWRAADRAPVVTVEMSTRFTDSTRPGARLEAEAAVRQTSGAMMFVDAAVREGERTVALATAVMKIARKGGPDGARKQG